MLKRFKFTCLLVLALIALGAVGHADEKAAATAKKPPANEKRSAILFYLFDDPQIVADLRLTTSQTKLIREAKSTFLTSAVVLLQQASRARQDLDGIIEEDASELKKAFDLVRRVNQLERDYERLLVSQHVAQSKILSPIQRQQLMDIVRFRRRIAREDMFGVPSSTEATVNKPAPVAPSSRPSLREPPAMRPRKQPTPTPRK